MIFEAGVVTAGAPQWPQWAGNFVSPTRVPILLDQLPDDNDALKRIIAEMAKDDAAKAPATSLAVPRRSWSVKLAIETLKGDPGRTARLLGKTEGLARSRRLSCCSGGNGRDPSA
jgi:hypothetical protein